MEGFWNPKTNVFGGVGKQKYACLLLPSWVVFCEQKLKQVGHAYLLIVAVWILVWYTKRHKKSCMGLNMPI